MATNKKEISFYRKVHFCFFTVVLDAQLEETGREINNKRYRIYNRTALHIAARKDLLEAAKWLINKGADLGAKDKYGITP